MNFIESYKRVLGLTYIQLAIIFTLAVLLRELHIIYSFTLNFILFASILPLFAIPALLDLKKTEKEVPVPYVSAIILFIVALIIIMRLIPYFHNPIPLGYDPGFYKYTMDTYIGGLPDIPEESLPLWMREMHEQGLFVLISVLHIFTKIDAYQAFKYLFPSLCGLLTLPIFILARSVFNERVAIIASALYAVSYTQYTAFTFLYFKNIIGLIFLLLALYALEKRQYAILAVMYAALGIYHRPEFLLFSLILVPYFIKTRDKNLIAGTIATAVLITPFWLHRLAINWGIMAGVAGSAASALQGAPLGGGTFFSYETYRWISLAYLPFGLVGALYLAIRRRFNALLFYFLICGAIVIFKLFFFNRLLIVLDLVLLILAAAGIYHTFVHVASAHLPLPSQSDWLRGIAPKALTIIAVITLLLSSGLITLDRSTHIKPLIDDGQFEAITWIANNTEPDSYVLATSYDAPWVLGWSNRKVIAPGLFQWDKHNESEWINFLGTDDMNTAKEFLDEYEPPIYTYYSKNWGNHLNLKKFENNYFEKVYDGGGSIIYRYDGGPQVT